MFPRPLSAALRPALRCLSALPLAAATLSASAAEIVGGSDLLDTARATQLQAWLGGDEIRLTNLFDKQPGHTAADFHAAVDGRGPTFAIIEVLAIDGTALAEPVLVGGYNPRSWNSSSVWNLSPTAGERTAFLFDLSAGTRFVQRGDGPGLYQTYNLAGYGPSFGIGADISVLGDLTRGSSSLFSYGSEGQRGSALTQAHAGGYLHNWRIGRIEVFGVEAASPVPEPGPLALWAAGTAVVLGVARRRRRA